MFSHWPIRYKLQLGLGLLAVSVLTLFGSAYYGLYAYRGLVRGLSARSSELPLANQLNQHVADLRVILSQVEERRRLDDSTNIIGFQAGPDQRDYDADSLLRQRYSSKFDQFGQALEQYRQQLDSDSQQADVGINDDRLERDCLKKIDALLGDIKQDDDDASGTDWLLDSDSKISKLRDKIDTLRELVAELPSHLIDRFHDAGERSSDPIPPGDYDRLGDDDFGGHRCSRPRCCLFHKWIARPLATLVQARAKWRPASSTIAFASIRTTKWASWPSR